VHNDIRTYVLIFRREDEDGMDRECRGAFDEFLELTPAERLQPYDLASKTHGDVALSNDQNNFNPYAHCSVQIARGH
jgi:hypothetical protein